MRTFEYQSNNYIPRVDLNTLGKSIDTLEQGHKEAIQTASQLQTAVANLDMDASEDGFKQRLIGEIQNTIRANTLEGNSYGALDKIIAQQGNIASDGGIIGRLRNNQLKKQYDAKVDAMKIPDGMKDMYKKENPYYYTDGGIDEKTGRRLPGKAWEATTNPVTTIPMTTIQEYALKIAAKEAGGGEMISFLDKNSKETFDASKSADGAMYRKVGTKCERLSKDKIEKAMKVAINSIPGAEDSLKQDYKYGMYQLSENQKITKNNPYMEGFTDKDGNIYTYDQWLTNSINNFKDVAAYNHTYNSVDFGTALQNRKAQEAKLQEQINGNQLPNHGAANVGVEDTEVNVYAGVQDSKRSASKVGMSIIQKYGMNYKHSRNISELQNKLIKDGLASGPNTVVTYLLNTYGTKMSNDDKRQLRDAIMGHYRADAQMQMITKQSQDAKDAILFNQHNANNELSSDNKYSRSLTHELNAFYRTHDAARYDIGVDLLNSIASNFGVNSINDLRGLGIDLTPSENDSSVYNVSITAQNRNILPRFIHYLENANSLSESNAWSGFKRIFGGRASRNNYVSYNDYDNTSTYIRNSLVYNRSKNLQDEINKIYSTATEQAASVERALGIKTSPHSIQAYDSQSYGEMWEREHNANLKPSELNAKIKEHNDRVDLLFSSGEFDSGILQEADAAGHFRKNLKSAQDAKLLIQGMYTDDKAKKQIKRQTLKASGINKGEPLGYILSFTVPKGHGNDSYKEGDHVKFKVAGVNIEDVSFYNPNFNPDVLAENNVLITKNTNIPIHNLGYTKDFGDTSLKPVTGGNYKSYFMGNDKIISANAAQQLSSCMMQLEDIKNNYHAGVYNGNDANTIALLTNSIKSIATNIAQCTGKNATSVYKAAINYIQY